MDWKKIGQELLEKVKIIRKDDSGWKLAKESKDVTVWWKQSTDWKGVIYKSEGDIAADPETVFHFINPLIPDAPRSRWDSSVKERTVLQTIDQNMSVVRTVTISALAGLISQREFIDLVAIDVSDEHFATNAHSIEYAEAESNGSSVRGTNYPSAIICKRLPDDTKRTRLTTYIQTDLGGMIPQSLVDQALPSSQINFFDSLKKALADAGHL